MSDSRVRLCKTGSVLARQRRRLYTGRSHHALQRAETRPSPTFLTADIPNRIAPGGPPGDRHRQGRLRRSAQSRDRPVDQAEAP